MAKPFDATTKELMEAGPEDWLVLLGLSAEYAEVIDADLATISAEADRVLRVTAPTPYLLHIEFQSGYDSTMPEHLLRYNVLLEYRHKLPVQSVVILLRREADGAAITETLRRQILDSDDPYLEFRYRAFRIWEQETSTLLGGGLAILPLAPLAASRDQVEDVIRAMQARIEREAPPAQARTLWTATFLLMGLRFSATFVARVLRGVQQMKESSTYQAILAEGRAEGKAEGKAEEARNIILRLGRKRFGEPSSALQATVAGINDLTRLENLMDRLLETESWDELLRHFSDGTPAS